VRWARYEVPPKIFSLLQEQKTVDAFLLIRQAQRYIPDDPQLEMLLSTMSFPRTVLTTPSGADVYFKDYMGVDAEWQYLGRTPMDNTFMPVGYLRLRIIRQGFETVIRAVNVYHMGDTLRIKLIPKGTGVPGMVLVPEGNQRLGSGDPVELQEYWIDKYEVTNRKYKEFVDAGGYQKREYWKQPIVKDGSALSWEQAMTEFRDATGRLGPLAWKLGTYPDGQAEYPVQGVSWYEAAAYAEFAGKSLPTVYHWRQAAGFGIFSDILTLSNFYEEGPVPGQTYPGLSLYGCFDMAGNVKEWCLNETEGWRYILGGAWNEPAYMFSGRDAQHPFKRTETFGFRCIQSAVPLSEILTGPVAVFHYDFSQEKPVKDDIFEIYKNLYSYDRTELVARMIAVDESSEYWRRETISYNAAYGDERVIANLYIPHNATPPYQAVVFFPGSNAKEQTSSENAFGMMFVDFIPRSGRALLFPVYKGTFERGGGNPIQGARASRDLMIQQGKDVLRSVDYLETREDINAEKIAFLGLSWGACEGPIFTAIEKRFKASILLGGGYSISRLKREPETNPINFGPRSRLPVLMVNGRYDFIFPLETSVVPMFDLQGAPEEDKRLVLFDSGHIPPGNDVIRETLDWLDRYLGPVQ